MIHLAVPVVLAAALAGTGVYAIVARRHLVMVLIGAELLLNAVNLLLVTATQLPSGGLARLHAPSGAPLPADPLLGGQVFAVFVITVAAAEIGLALAVVLLLFRARTSVDVDEVADLGEASAAARVAEPAAPAAPEGPGADVATAGAVREAGA